MNLDLGYATIRATHGTVSRHPEGRAMNRNPRVVRSIVGLSILAAAIAMAITHAPGSVSAQTDTVTIELAEVDVPGVSGTATLSARGEATLVDLRITGPEVTGDHPTHIHTGTCDNFDPNPLYPLSTVVLDPVDDLGWSTTEVDDVTLDELLADEFVVVIHLSEAELTTYLACGEIAETSGPTEEEPSPTTEAAEPTAEVSAPTATTSAPAATAATPAAGGSVPTTGVGSTVRSETGLLTLALGAAAALLLAAALGLRLRAAGADR